MLRAPRNRTPASWAKENRRLPSGSPIPGRFDPDTAPYLLQPLQDFLDPTVSMVVLCTAAQMGKTEAILILTGWRLDDRPRPMIYLAPTRKLAVSVMKDRLAQLIETTPNLSRNADTRRGFNSTLERWVGGVRLGIAWAGSSVEIMSHPCALCLCDEVDQMVSGAQQAGDPVSLAHARTKAYRDGKTFVCSTPTDEGASAIWSWWEQGSKHRWYLKCRDCGEWFLPRVELLDYPKDADADAAKAAARLVCDACGVAYDDTERRQLLGKYFPHVEQDGEYVRADVPVISAIRSYAVSGLVSPTTSIGEIAFQLRSSELTKDPEKIQVAVNAYAGELYRVEGDSPGWEGAWNCRAGYDTPPPETQLITAGVDPGKRYLRYVIRAWGYPSEASWLLEWGELRGDTAMDDIWIKLATLLKTTYNGIPIKSALVDSGYTPGDRFARPESIIYKHCRIIPNAWPSKGVDHLDRPHRISRIDSTASGKTRRGGVRLVRVNSHHWKQWLYARIGADQADPGAWRIPLDVSEQYCREVTNEECVFLPSGKYRWQRTGDRQNHYLDCEVLAAVAADLEDVQKLGPIRVAPRRREKPHTDPSLDHREL